MRKILYLHGFASAFKPEGSKALTLSNFFEVVPFTYDTGAFYEENLQKMKDIIQEKSIDVVMGSSMGGFYTIQLAAELNIPGVALNPAHNLKQELSQSVGRHINYETGKMFKLKQEVVDSYPNACHRSGDTLILFMEGDELLNAKQAQEDLSAYFDFKMIPGGQHRFENLDAHMNEILMKIEQFYSEK